MQGWEFTLSLIRSLLFCSKSLIFRSFRERFTHITLYKRVNCSLKKSGVSDLLVIRVNRSQRTSELLAKNEQIACKERANRLKNSYFCMFLTNFPLFMPKSKSLPPIIGSFSESVLSDSLPLLFTKEQPWAIVSGRSWQKSDGSHSLFFTSESLFCSQKMSESLEKPMSVFPTLALWMCSKCVMFMQYDSVTNWNILHTARSSSIVSLILRPLDTTCQLE